jgi:hypothetical protein
VAYDSAVADDIVSVTMGLSKSGDAFFKEAAVAYNTSYQKMIRRLLDEYVERSRD